MFVFDIYNITNQSSVEDDNDLFKARVALYVRFSTNFVLSLSGLSINIYFSDFCVKNNS